MQYNHLTSPYNPVIAELSLDDEEEPKGEIVKHKFLKIIAAVEANEQDQSDLIGHVNSHYFKLTDHLSKLTSHEKLLDSKGPSYLRPGPGSP